MVTNWVVDASIAVKLFRSESDSLTARQVFAGLSMEQRAMAPSLLRYEIGNACARASMPGLELALQRFLAGIQTVEPQDVARFTDGLSYYDAAYLALAVEQKAGLLTADDNLRKAAKKHGVEVGP